MKSPLPPIILASASPRRQELLAGAKFRFETLPSDAEEILDEEFTATELAQINAYRKTRAVAKQHRDALVIGADTLVFLDAEVFGKPRNLRQAQSMLSKLQGETHRVVTGVCLIHLRAHWEKLFAEVTEVTFAPLTAAQIRDYFRFVNPLDKAGAYAIQERGDLIVKSIRGSMSNVIGLPMERLTREIGLRFAPARR